MRQNESQNGNKSQMQQYLSQLSDLQERLETAQSIAQQINDLVGSPPSILDDSMRGRNSKGTDAPFVQELEQAEEIMEWVRKKSMELTSLKAQIHDVICTVLNLLERETLRYRYIDGKSWQDIANEFNVSKATVYRWHRNALQHAVLPQDAIWIS